MTYWHSTRYPNTIGYVSFNSRINSFNQIEAVFNYYAIRASFFFRLLKLLFQNIVSFSLRIRMVGNKKSGTKLEKYFTIQLFILRLILSNWYNRSKCDSLSNNSMWYFLQFYGEQFTSIKIEYYFIKCDGLLWAISEWSECFRMLNH